MNTASIEIKVIRLVLAIITGSILLHLIGVKDPAILVAGIALAWSIWENTSSVKRKEEEVKRAEKKRIMSALVENRFLLVNPGKYPEDVSEFNKAISRIPIEFVDHREVVEKCFELTEFFKKKPSEQNKNKNDADKEFAEKLHSLLGAMYEATNGSPLPDYFTSEVLGNVLSIQKPE